MTEPATPPVVPQAPPTGKRTERPHPLTPFIRGWIVLLAVVIAIGREFLPDGRGPRALPPLELILGGVGLVAVGAGLAGFISWRFTRFVIDTDELRIDTGAIFRNSVRVAFDKVQAIDVVQPFAARLFGLAELQIDIGSHERSKVRYLKLSRAQALRDYLLARARGVQAEIATQPVADFVIADLAAEDEVLVRVPPQTLLLAAVTSHEFWGIVVSGATMMAIGLATGQWWLILGALIPTVSALFGFVTRRVTGQFNYVLSRRAHGLRISRGLTSLTSQSMPQRRIQAVQLSQSPVWRSLGLYRIDVEVIGWGNVTEDEDKTGVSTILLPVGSIEQVRVALNAIWPRASFEDVPLHGAPARARWLHPFSQPFLRWGHDDALVVSRHGWLVRRWQLVPTARIQSVRVAQGVFSRRLGLADLEFHTAGAQIEAHAAGVDAAHVLERQEELLRLVHHLPAHDLSEALPPTPAPPGPTGPPMATAPGAWEGTAAGTQAGGPEARRADQAEPTISSTE